MSLKAGKEALLRKHYTEAIAILREYTKDHPDITAKDYIQAQMLLVRAYQGVGRPDKAIPICEGLMLTGDPQLQDWARRSLISLRQQLAALPEDRIQPNEEVASVAKTSARRYKTKPVVLALPPLNQWLFWLAMAGTVALILGISLGIGLIAVAPFYVDWQIPTLLVYLVVATILVCNLILFFMSPWLIDITQKQYQRTQWITLADLEPRSPEAVETIEQFCEQHRYIVPRLGWIDSPVPLAFSYGILPNSARIVVSRGLFECLDDDEIAAVYGYHLGRIATWSFTVITYGSAPLQILYFIYVSLMRASFQAKTGNSLIRLVANIFFVLYRLGDYCLCFLTRRSTPLCDRFAAEITGNPNALTRALVKMSRGLWEQHQLGSPPNRLLDSTRVLGFLDYRTSTAVGMAWQILHAGQSNQNLYEVMLWELASPWAGWMQVNSSHPLIAKRIAILTGYTKQLGLEHEYEFRELEKKVAKLDRKRLKRHFYRDFLIQISPYLSLLIAFIFPITAEWLIKNYLSQRFNMRWHPNFWLLPSLVLIALGLSFMFQGSLRYPNFRRAIDTNLVGLLINPYTSPILGLPVRLPGEITSYSSSEYLSGYTLKLEDQGGSIYVHYTPGYGEGGTNNSRTLQKLAQLLDQSVIVTGWYRRDFMPIIDLHSIQPLLTEGNPSKFKPIQGYHQFWNNVLSSALLLGGLLILLASSPLF